MRHLGSVDIGVAVTGIYGAVGDVMLQRGEGARIYPNHDFRSTERVLAADLAARPRAVAL